MTFDSTQSAHQALKKILAERTSPVVAWIGSGLSAPAGLPSWDSLLNTLIAIAKRKNDLLDENEERKSLLRTIQEEQKKKNYWVCFQLLEEVLGQTTYQAEIRDLLDASSHKEIPKSYGFLWRAGIQGMISFNLDQFAIRSFSQEFPGKNIDNFVGDQSKNLGTVLQRNLPFVGNVHGVIDNASTWIFTHDKLSQLLSNEGYLRFISSCLLSRTIIFIGISADDIAVKTHLENIKRAGINGITHYWITSRNESLVNAWSEQVSVRQIIYSAPDNNHSDLLECLEDLKLTTLPQDQIVKDPVLISSIQEQENDSLLPPDELVIQPLEKIRHQLNSHALTLLKNPNNDAYQKYEQFSNEYDEAIDRAWYTALIPPKDQLFGYTLKRRVSQGSFGDVYEAIDPKGNRIAIKLLRRDVRRDPAMLQTFRRGVRSMQILKQHAAGGMVEFIDASEIPAFVAMEWINGPDLMEAYESRILSDWRTILLVARDLSSIIYKAHTLPERVLHRDIRPPNVMLKNYWANESQIEVVVMDFDLSWHVDALEKSIVAKPLGFMAPEQLHHRPKESTRSALVDSFGLGMTVFYMITGDIPVPDQQKHTDWESTLRRKVQSRNCAEWKSVSYRVSRLIQGATQDVQHRRWDFAKIVAELENLYTAASGDGSILPIDYHAEEIAAYAETMPHYLWDDARMVAIYKSGGLKIEISGDAPSDEIILLMEWQQTGDENWKQLPKTGAQIKEKARPSLEKHGWKGTKFDASYGLMRVSASVNTRSNFEPKKLAKGIDILVQAMLPRS